MKWLAVAVTLLAAAPVAAVDAPLVAWFEIPVRELDRATHLHEAVFGKSLQRDHVDGYDMAMLVGAGGPEGALVKGDVYVPGKAGPTLYFRVDDLDGVLVRAN